MQAQVTDEHRWLHALAGEWHAEMPGPDGGTMPMVETVRRVGDAWLVFEALSASGAAGADGGPHTVMTVGFDPAQCCFVGSWIGSMMNHLWVYRDGTLDAARRVLALHSEGPRFDGTPGTARYRDEIELLSADERLLHGHVLGDDGVWSRFMTARYLRRR